MRLRLAIAVLLVVAFSLGVIYAWQYAVRRTRQAARSVVAQIAVSVVQPVEISRETSAVDLSGRDELTIENEFGDIEIAVGGPTASIERVVYARGRAPEEARSRGVSFRLERSDDPEVGCRIVAEADGTDPNLRYATLKLVVKVPPQVAVRAVVTNGGIVAKGLGASVSAKSASGDIIIADSGDGVSASSASGNISVTRAQGAVSVDSASGDVGVTWAQAGVTANCGSGNVRLEDVEGPVVARTMDGDVSLRGVRSGQVAATTMSGDVNVQLTRPVSGKVEARTQSGDIGVAIPSSSDCRVRATTNSGEVRSSLPLQDVTRAGPNISGRLGSGKGTVEVSTGSGDITLAAAG